ncbi:MAG: FAD-dependent oxidoreductase [Gammaproteobacteria bacterium]|nr:FAD-dependent oxidoreductase [Gammaproteobacteria bacterium]MDH5172751.1 FAD-dependent oxidoreductase [Gammaproteobacteria bacterium]
MTDSTRRPGFSRRDLLAGLGAAAAGTIAAGAGALPAASVSSWDMSTDVLVAGSGAAGASAAIEARRAGAEVLVIESLPRFGGSSAMSAGVVYAGGGTALQRALGVEDSVEDMFRFISGAGGAHPPLDKIRLYCEQSSAHFDWLVEQGVPYAPQLAGAMTVPMAGESLYFSGCELAWPARELARPAPRGHVPVAAGMTGGRVLMEALLARVKALGATLQADVAGQRLVVAGDGRVLGMEVTVAGERRTIRARRGIVLASGGFIHNREMVRKYAPELYDCAVPWGNVGDQGMGINMGIAVGAAALRMHQGFAIVPMYPPESVLSGIVVNAVGQRFVAEDTYYGVLGDAIAYHQQGRAWLVTDQRSKPPALQDNFVQVAQGNTIGDLADQLGFPKGALQETVAYYNRHALNGEDPLFRKRPGLLRPVQGPPYRAWDLSVKNSFVPAHTFGGLQTGLDGEVINSFGEVIPGLYAAGRNSAGLPGAPYIASGLSVGDATFFGRRAGLAAAGPQAGKKAAAGGRAL